MRAPCHGIDRQQFADGGASTRVDRVQLSKVVISLCCAQCRVQGQDGICR